MYSATWPQEVRRLASTYMKDPFQVSVGSLDLRVSVRVCCVFALSLSLSLSLSKIDCVSVKVLDNSGVRRDRVDT